MLKKMVLCFQDKDIVYIDFPYHYKVCSTHIDSFNLGFITLDSSCYMSSFLFWKKKLVFLFSCIVHLMWAVGYLGLLYCFYWLNIFSYYFYDSEVYFQSKNFIIVTSCHILQFAFIFSCSIWMYQGTNSLTESFWVLNILFFKLWECTMSW